MPHIHTEPGHHDQTVAAFILRTDGDEPRALFHMHKKYGVLLCASGHVELNESPWAAVLREIKEEAGYSPEQLQIMQPRLRITQEGFGEISLHPQPLFADTHMNLGTVDHWHTDQVYLFVTTEAPHSQPAEGESLDQRWLSRAEIAASSNDEMFENVRVTHLQVIDKFLSAWEPLAVDSFSTEKVKR